METSRREFLQLSLATGFTLCPPARKAHKESRKVIEDLRKRNIRHVRWYFPGIGADLIVEMEGPMREVYRNLEFEVVHLNGKVEYPEGEGISAETEELLPGMAVIWYSNGRQIGYYHFY